MKQKWWLGVFVGVFWGVSLRCFAVIVAQGDGTQNATAPSGDRGWSYVGRISNKPSSVTYLSNNWFVTAYHVKHYDSPTSVLLNGSSYAIDDASWTRMTNSTGSDADLVMFRVTDPVGLAGVSIASVTPASETTVTMIGDGLDRASDLTYWHVDTGSNPYVWTETNAANANASGYKWLTTATKRWGENQLEGTVSALDDGFGLTDCFYSDFDNQANEAQGATYDSGGGVFVTNGSGGYDLAGLMITVGNYSGQPAETSVFGDRTYMADLSVYADQMRSTTMIPEPGILSLMLAMAGSCFWLRRLFL